MLSYSQYTSNLELCNYTKPTRDSSSVVPKSTPHGCASMFPTGQRLFEKTAAIEGPGRVSQHTVHTIHNKGLHPASAFWMVHLRHPPAPSAKHGELIGGKDPGLAIGGGSWRSLEMVSTETRARETETDHETLLPRFGCALFHRSAFPSNFFLPPCAILEGWMAVSLVSGQWVRVPSACPLSPQDSHHPLSAHSLLLKTAVCPSVRSRLEKANKHPFHTHSSITSLLRALVSLLLPRRDPQPSLCCSGCWGAGRSRLFKPPCGRNLGVLDPEGIDYL